MKQITLFITALLLVGCTSLADKATETNATPPIFPDYIGITIPINIAPTNFMIERFVMQKLSTTKTIKV